MYEEQWYDYDDNWEQLNHDDRDEDNQGNLLYNQYNIQDCLSNKDEIEEQDEL